MMDSLLVSADFRPWLSLGRGSSFGGASLDGLPLTNNTKLRVSAMAPRIERIPWEASLVSPGSWFRSGVQNLRTHMHLCYANTPSPYITRQTYMRRYFVQHIETLRLVLHLITIIDPCPRSSAAR